MNIGPQLEHWARYKPDDTAVVCGANRVSHSTHAQRVRQVARALLALGLSPGDRIALVLGNRIELLELYRAAALLGLVSVPLSPMLQAPALAALLRDSGSSVVFADAGTAALAEAALREIDAVPQARLLLVGVADAPPLRNWLALVMEQSGDPLAVPAVDPEHPYNIVYSSGTTGLPKGIVHTHRIRALYGLLFAQRFAIANESVVLHGGSLVFNGAFPTLMPAWLKGCRYVLLERFDPAAWIAAVRTERVSHAIVVPSQLAALLHDPGFTPEALLSLRVLCSLGAPLPREHKEQLLGVLPDCALWELYGLTEGFVTVLDGREFRAHMDSVGTPLAFNEMRIADTSGQDLAAGEVGEILGKGPLLMPGYWQRPDLTAEAIVDGWLHTGDLGSVDADGYLHLVDRQKDMIISGGVNVYPRDIEEVAARHPDVREVAVFGVADERHGECPVAAVVPAPGPVPDTIELREWINERVGARYQRVREVVLLEEMPRNIAGKALKRVLRERYDPSRAPA